MRANQWLVTAKQQLEQANIGTARLDALVLLEDTTGKDRAWLLAHPEFELEAVQVEELEKLLKRRALHEPLSYLRSKTEFYGREFVLTPAVLEPRPESETMIDLLKALVIPAADPESGPQKRDSEAPSPLAILSASEGPQTQILRSTQHNKLQSSTVRIADVGTGSGALGITAALELPNAQLELLEIDSEALQVAKMNVDKFTLNISVIQSDLLEGSTLEPSILLCNLPYVPDGHTINRAASREPKLAIFGGPDGLDVYRRLFEQIDQLPKKPLYILTESLPPQHTVLEQIAISASYLISGTSDFIQVFKLA